MPLARIRDLLDAEPEQFAQEVVEIDRQLRKQAEELRRTRERIAQLRGGDHLFVSAEVASVVLGKSVSMVTHLCRTGALSSKKVGGTWQIDRLALEQLRMDGRVAAARAD